MTQAGPTLLVCLALLTEAVTGAIGVANGGHTAPKIVQNVPDALPAISNVCMKRPERSQSMNRKPFSLFLNHFYSRLTLRTGT